MRKIYLKGRLASFGKEFDFEVDSVSEAVRALATQIKGFRQALVQGEYRVYVGGELFDETECFLHLEDQDITILPVPAGSKNGGFFKVILGIALLGIGFMVGASTALLTVGGTALITGSTLITLGAGLALAGIGMMLSPTPQTDSQEAVDKRQSYLFRSPVNLVEEGNALPVAYGMAWCGSLVLSAGIDIKEVI